MSKQRKPTDGTNKVKSSGALVSILIHIAIVLILGLIYIKVPPKKTGVIFGTFEDKRPDPPELIKPTVTPSDNASPKATPTIAVDNKAVASPDFAIPEAEDFTKGLMTGINVMPTLSIEDFGPGLIGGKQSTGDDFVGRFYDLKRDRMGRNIVMDPEKYLHALKEFVRNDWNPVKLSEYYRSDNKLFTPTIMVPPVLSSIAPAAFEENTTGYCWAIHYSGQLVHKERIRFRFWGVGDDVLLVRVGGKVVLNASWPSTGRWDSEGILANATKWRSTSADSRKYYMGNNRAVVGDWITLNPKDPVDMEVLIGELPGGQFSAMLTVEVDGVEYERNEQGGPILPVFKTTELSRSLVDTIYMNLVEGEASVLTGPVFCDYSH